MKNMLSDLIDLHMRLGYVLLGIDETLCLQLVRHENLDLLHENISNP